MLQHNVLTSSNGRRHNGNVVLDQGGNVAAPVNILFYHRILLLAIDDKIDDALQYLWHAWLGISNR